MTFRHGIAAIPLLLLLGECGGTPKAAPDPLSQNPCRTWEVTVDNELPFPVSVFVYSEKRRTALGAVFPGTSQLKSPDSGQITFTPPLGQSLIQRGRQVRSKLNCIERAPT